MTEQSKVQSMLVKCKITGREVEKSSTITIPVEGGDPIHVEAYTIFQIVKASPSIIQALSFDSQFLQAVEVNRAAAQGHQSGAKDALSSLLSKAKQEGNQELVSKLEMMIKDLLQPAPVTEASVEETSSSAETVN